MKNFTFKLLTGLFAFVLCSPALAATATGDVSVNGTTYAGGITYTYTASNGNATITAVSFDSSIPSSGVEVSIPTELDGNKVTALGAECFKEKSNLSVVALPEGITSIGSRCFLNSQNLVTVTLPSTLESLSYECFRECKKLENVNLSEGLKSLGYECFYSCGSLKNIALPSTLTSLGYACFWYTGLTSIEIPEGVTSLDDECFQSCTSLESVKIPEGVTSLGENCFAGCTSLKSIELPNSIATLKKWSLGMLTGLEYIVIPTGNLTTLGENPLFYSNSNLTVIFKGEPNSELTEDNYKNLLQNSDSYYDVSYPVEETPNYTSLFSATTGNVSAYRITSARYSTVCLPYTVNVSGCSGVTTFYREKTSSENDKLGLADDLTYISVREETNQLTKGKPYIFEQTSGSGDQESFTPRTQFGITGYVAFKLSNPKEEAATEPANDTYLKGSFEHLTYDDLNNTGCYLMQSGVFKKWANNNAWLDAYRGYLDLSSVSASSKSVVLRFEKETTGINKIVPVKDIQDGSIYNLQGQRIAAPVRGQIYIQNGRKFIAK